MKVVTSDQMRQIDRNAASFGLPTEILMENAGRAIANETIKLISGFNKKNILVLVGPGNNGGDGLVAARYLKQNNFCVAVYLCSKRSDNDINLSYIKELQIPIIQASEDENLTQLNAYLNSCNIIIDAIFGTGKKRELTGIYKHILSKLSSAKEKNKDLFIIAVDLPSGMDADNGSIDPVCPQADVTITLGLPKAGLFNFPGAKRAGKVIVADIGIPQSLIKDLNIEIITEEYIASVLPNRSPNSNKGTFGKVLVLGGSFNYTGAVYLACMGAFRAGAGLVTLAVAKSLYPIMASKLIETTYLPLPEIEPGIIGPNAVQILKDQLRDYRVLLIGCGLGQHSKTTAFLQSLLFDSSQMHFIPIIIDADGLNALSKSPEWWQKLGQNVILTPHPGEMARLTDTTVEEVQQDRLSHARNAAADWNKIVVLKGAYTIIAAPDGRCKINPYANAVLATAGTGDVLAGIIAGLVGQNVPLFDAAACGVYLHSMAGEYLADKMGNAGIVASDLLTVIPNVIHKIKGIKYDVTGN